MKFHNQLSPFARVHCLVQNFCLTFANHAANGFRMNILIQKHKNDLLAIKTYNFFSYIHSS